jgi:hypothetical protein
MAKEKDLEDAFDLLCDIVDAWELEEMTKHKRQTVRKIQKAARFLYSMRKDKIDDDES